MTLHAGEELFYAFEQRFGIARAVVTNDFLREAVINRGYVLVESGAGICFDFLHFLQTAAGYKEASGFAVVRQNLDRKNNSFLFNILQK